MAVPVLFYRGPKSSYDVSQHGNGIYFCTDTYEIFMNNHSYGGEGTRCYIKFYK